MKFIDSHPKEERLDWYYASRNPNLTMEDILSHPNKNRIGMVYQ